MEINCGNSGMFTGIAIVKVYLSVLWLYHIPMYKKRQHWFEFLAIFVGFWENECIPTLKGNEDTSSGNGYVHLCTNMQPIWLCMDKEVSDTSLVWIRLTIVS